MRTDGMRIKRVLATSFLQLVYRQTRRVNLARFPPPSEQVRKIEAMVNKAAALVESQGKAAFSELRKRDSEWWFGNTYVFAYDQNLNVLLNPAFPKQEGPIPFGKRCAALMETALATVFAAFEGSVLLLPPHSAVSVDTPKSP